MLFLVAGSAFNAGLCLDPPHNESADPPIDCYSCHSWFPGWVSSPRGVVQETVCRSCHNPTGQASGKSEVAMHIVNSGVTVIDCDSCHNPHVVSSTTDPHSGITANNLDLIRYDTTRYWPAAVIPAIFQTEPSNFSFLTAPYTGICQTCHVNTNHHTNTGVDPHHYSNTGCVGCHPHIDGFLPTGGGSCLDCHSVRQDDGDGVPPNGRRAVTGEFPLGDAHAHYGAALDESDCTVCHSMTTHMDGFVDLIDPDSGAVYRFVNQLDLTSDPDLSNFCQNCHDSDGATRLANPMNPFGDDSSPPDVKTRFMGTLRWDEWSTNLCMGATGTLRQVNSHHDISDSDQAWSGAKIECTSCHGAHNSGATLPVADPFDTTVSWTNTINNFCLACHNGGRGPDSPGFPAGVTGPTIPLRGLESCDYYLEPWWVNYKWSVCAHGPSSKNSWIEYSGAPSAELSCLDCHDEHGSYSTGNPAGNPFIIRDYVDGTMYIDDGPDENGYNGPPWTQFGSAGEVVISIDGTHVGLGDAQGLCTVCHPTWIEALHWHASCDGCISCHSHGNEWGEWDWGPDPDDSSPCVPLKKALTAPDSELPSKVKPKPESAR
jgi:hypothetical protein